MRTKIVIGCLLLFACGTTYYYEPTPVPSVVTKNCLVTKVGKIATIECPSSSTTVSDGHSLVTSSRAASTVECSVSGTVLDVYLDIDDSGVVSLGDVLQNTLTACNGPAGPAGANGTSATANIVKTTLTTTCVLLGGTTLYGKKQSSTSTNVDVYATLTNCTAQTSSLQRLTATGNELYWFTDKILITLDVNLIINVLTFN